MSSQREPSTNKCLSKSNLIEILNYGVETMTNHYRVLTESFLNGSKPLPRARASNTQCLVAPLVCHFLFGETLDWTSVAGEAIASGLLTTTLDDRIVDEPIVHSAIVAALNQMLKDNYETLFATIASPLVDFSGGCGKQRSTDGAIFCHRSRISYLSSISASTKIFVQVEISLRTVSWSTFRIVFKLKYLFAPFLGQHSASCSS
jgi:hypothetical protein